MGVIEQDRTNGYESIAMSAMWGWTMSDWTQAQLDGVADYLYLHSECGTRVDEPGVCVGPAQPSRDRQTGRRRNPSGPVDRAQRLLRRTSAHVREATRMQHLRRRTLIIELRKSCRYRRNSYLVPLKPTIQSVSLGSIKASWGSLVDRANCAEMP